MWVVGGGAFFRNWKVKISCFSHNRNQVFLSRSMCYIHTFTTYYLYVYNPTCSPPTHTPCSSADIFSTHVIIPTFNHSHRISNLLRRSTVTTVIGNHLINSITWLFLYHLRQLESHNTMRFRGTETDKWFPTYYWIMQHEAFSSPSYHVRGQFDIPSSWNFKILFLVVCRMYNKKNAKSKRRFYFPLSSKMPSKCAHRLMLWSNSIFFNWWLPADDNTGVPSTPKLRSSVYAITYKQQFSTYSDLTVHFLCTTFSIYVNVTANKPSCLFHVSSLAAIESSLPNWLSSAVFFGAW